MSDQVGNLSVEERMLAFVEQEDTPPEVLDDAENEVEPDEEPQATSEESAESEIEPEEVSKEETLTGRKLRLKHNGQEVELDEAEVVNLAQQGYDYTKKTQELADARKVIDSHVQAIKAQEQAFQQQVHIQSALVGDIAKVTAIDEQIAEFNGLDWNALSDSDPVQAQKLFFQFNQLQSQRQKMTQALGVKQQQMQALIAEQVKRQTAAGLEQLRRDIPDWGEAKVKEIRQSAAQYGFSEKELQGITDPRVVKVLLDASQWRKLQSTKPVAEKKLTASPQVKPGAKDTKAATQGGVKQTRELLHKTGKSEYAAKLIERML